VKHVLLVTLFDDNYGNRLQNYALQTVIENQGFEVTNAIQPRPTDTNSKLSRVKNLAVDFLALCGLEQYKKKRNIRVIRGIRSDNFYEFNRKYIKKMIPIQYNNYAALDLEKFDYAITGSDQVWHNWDHADGELDYFYLRFIDKEKRIAYAPSFGFSIFPDEDKNTHIKGISGINKLSVREHKGAQLIHDYTGREATLVLDPTMLLRSTDWDEITKRPKEKLPNKYLFLYFLGERTSSVIEGYKKVCHENNLELIDIFDKESPFYSMGPSEFIWIIKNADYVCTDSFHATVFSIIYHKEFTVFKRAGKGYEDMFNRIENLLNEFDLMNRVFKDNNDHTNVLKTQSTIDWVEIEEILNSRKRDSMSYLLAALER
jgi:hypothetical protein